MRILIAGTVLLLAAGCAEAERASEDAGEAVEDASEAVESAVEDATSDIEAASDEAMEAMEAIDAMEARADPGEWEDDEEAVTTAAE